MQADEREGAEPKKSGPMIQHNSFLHLTKGLAPDKTVQFTLRLLIYSEAILEGYKQSWRSTGNY